MKNKIVYVFILACFVLSGCNDFLEPESKSEFVPKDAGALNELLLGRAYPRRDVPNMNIFLYLLDDDITASSYQRLTQLSNDEDVLAAYTWQSDMHTTFDNLQVDGNIYYTYYSRILGANAILDYVDDIRDTEENLNLVKAQAYALRGFFYFNIVNIYGAPYNSNKKALGVPLKLNSGVEKESLSRNTVEEVYTQIVADLLEAERLYKTLPDKEQWKADFRTSLPMVQLMLSRTYLYMEDWENAAEYAEKVIANPNFTLINLNNLQVTDDSGNRIYLNFHSYVNSPEAIWLYGDLNDMTKYLKDTYADKNFYENTFPLFRASSELLACFDEEEGDLRKEHYIVRSDVEILNDEGETELFPYPYGKINISPSSFQPLRGSNTFGRSLRLSEAYLNLCEAKAMIYKTTGDASARDRVLEMLNTLRINRFTSDAYEKKNFTDANELLNFIKEERRRELCFEDHRWFDLRRWGMPSIQHVWYPNSDSKLVYTLEANDLGYTLPLPQESLDQNANLEQNPLAPAPRRGKNK